MVYTIKSVNNISFTGFDSRTSGCAMIWGRHEDAKRYRRLQAAYNAVYRLRCLGYTVAVYDENGQEVDLTKLEKAENSQLHRAGYPGRDRVEAKRYAR